MLALFLLRLACGLAGAMLLLAPAQVNPRFFRAHFLIILGLTAGATVLLWQSVNTLVWISLAACIALSFLGSLIWSLENAPAARTVGAFAFLSLGFSLFSIRFAADSDRGIQLLADDLSSAALLGSAMTAMLIGHSYLVAPSMSMTPLRRLLGAYFVSLIVRVAICGVGLWFWTTEHSLSKLDNVTLLLLMRWGLGFCVPAFLGLMAWQTAKIRSTQSATGILYVVLIFSFLGEVTSQLLSQMTGTLL